MTKEFATESDDFEVSLMHKNADRCQRRQVDILISRCRRDKD